MPRCRLGRFVTNRLQQVAGRVDQLAQQQQDQQLRDLLGRQNIRVNAPASTTTTPTVPATTH